MKLDQHVITGVFFGLVFGMHYHGLDAYKDVLTIVAVVLALGVVGGLKLGKLIK
ncbi:MAG: hypothetical protein HY601_03145 [Candidatus Omnitrophica bacterium]|nr:hypothetical protein [Candidatus Omnitrophota bacterium]